jgi:hypothetical protein
LQATDAAARDAIERFLKAMVNSESLAQIDKLPGNLPGGEHGD